MASIAVLVLVSVVLPRAIFLPRKFHPVARSFIVRKSSFGIIVEYFQLDHNAAP